MYHDPYVCPMSKEDWNEFKRGIDNLQACFDSAWDWDRTAELCTLEVLETSDCIVLSIAFRTGGYNCAITLTNQNPEELLNAAQQTLIGLGWHWSDWVGTPKKLTLDKQERQA